MRRFVATLAALAVCSSTVAEAQERAVTRHEAVLTAIQSNTALLVDAMEQELAEHRTDEARRPYAPVVFASPAYIASRQAVRTSESEDATILSQAQLDADVGVRWDNRWGTSLALRASTTPWYSDFAPTPLTSIEASASQSLLRHGFRHGTRLDSVDLEVELQRALFRAEVEELVRRVDAAYWQLAFAQADVENKVKARDRAKSQFEDTQENIRRGLLAPGDIFVVEENLVIFEEQLLRAHEALKLAQLSLANLMQLEDPSTALVVADSVEPDPKLPTTQQALAIAMNESPRVIAQRVIVRQARSDVNFDKNRARPILDLSGAVGFDGLDDDFGPSWGNALSGENPSVRVGLYFEVPLVSRAYRASIKRAELEHERERRRLAQVESDLGNEVRRVLVQLESRIASLDFAKRRVTLAENKLQTEQDKYERGLATLTDVVRFQRDVDSAQVAERRARVQVVTLRSELAALQGTLAGEAGIQLE